MSHFHHTLWIALIFCLFLFPHSKSLSPSLSAAYELPMRYSNLPRQDRALVRDLIMLNFPPFDWRKEENKPTSGPIYDVAIIGAGMAGLTAGAALFKEGIFNIKLFDQAANGLEGPWITYARMKTLRSHKEIMGPALGIPHLTFHAWYEAVFGAEAWQQLGKIPNELWMDYLKWYRQALQLPVENNCLLTDLVPSKEGFELRFEQQGTPLLVKARKVVLATGREGFGGPYIPAFATHLPKSLCAHTIDPIDFASLKDRRIGIIGVGASSFDAAATALETGAASVDLIMRRDQIPNINKFSCLPFKGFNHGYFKLSDERRWEFMCEAFEAAIPPTIESIKRIDKYSNLRVITNAAISHVDFDDSKIKLETSRGTYNYDFLILGTGYNIDGYQQPELRRLIDLMILWKDRIPADIVAHHPKMAFFPYLGPSYEFLPKDPDAAPYLKNLYCFNYAATLSHGLLSADIPAISMGATRLAEGIAADFFIQSNDSYLKFLKDYQYKDFEKSDYSLRFE